MLDILKRYVLDNIWCNPDQDKQYIFEAMKISSPYGELNTMRLMDRYQKLPHANLRYHVFQIGQLHPSFIGLMDYDPYWVGDRWVSFDSVMEKNNLIVTIYDRKGVCVPNFSAYYCFTKERALIFAVPVDHRLALDYEDEALYLRLYTNAFYQDVPSGGMTYGIKVHGKYIEHRDHLMEVQRLCRQYDDLPGLALVYKNGLRVDSVGPMNTEVGDVIEIIYDPSVKREVRFKVKDLPVFFSELDGCNKYLLHHLCNAMETIEYQDDMDVFLIKEDEYDRYTGVYHHRNQWNNHRMVTHRDYSIKVDHVQFLTRALTEYISEVPLDFGEFTVQLVIRRGGYERPLVFDNNRIFELYKLPHDKILSAMVGLNSTVEEWRASVLESSGYTEVMSLPSRSVTATQVERALGYNSMSKVLGDTPVKVRKLQNYSLASLKPAQYRNSTVYEYDEGGRLIYVNYVKQEFDYVSSTPGLDSVEVLVGKGSQDLEAIYGEDNLVIPRKCGIRVYMCYLQDGVPDGNWRDITGSDYYTIEDQKLVWSGLETSQWLMVRTDRNFLSYELQLEEYRGLYTFDLAELKTSVDGKKVMGPMEVPLGQLDLFLNGYSLIAGLDYIVDFPRIQLLNYSHLKEGSVQTVTVRFHGFCDENLQMEPIGDYGFVQHDLLSNNNRFDIRDDKVLRITVDGRMKHRDQVRFSEEHDGVSILNTTNGMPYQIKDIVVPLGGSFTECTSTLRAKSQRIDEKVSDYLSLYLPQPPRDAQDAITRRYYLVSPFSSALLYALVSGTISYDTLAAATSDMDIIELCKPYEYLLEYDPINEDLGFDLGYVQPIAHRGASVVSLRFHQYRVYKRAMILYAKDRLDISTSVVIIPE